MRRKRDTKIKIDVLRSSNFEVTEPLHKQPANNTTTHSEKAGYLADYSDLTEKIETNSKSFNFKVGGRFRTTTNKNVFRKGYTENWSKKYLLLILY